MFVCPTGFALVAFCANLLANTFFAVGYLRCYNVEDMVLQTPQGVWHQHLSCCDIETYHIYWYCFDYTCKGKSLPEYLKSSDRASYYVSHSRHFDDMARDLIKAAKPGLLGLPALSMGVSSWQLQSEGYDYAHQDYRIFLSDGTVACLRYDYSKVGFCLTPFGYYKSSKCDLFIYDCDAETQRKVLDLRKFLKKAHEKSEDYILVLPTYSEEIINNNDNLLQPGQPQLLTWGMEEKKKPVSIAPSRTTTKTTTTTRTTTTMTTTTTRAPTAPPTIRIDINKGFQSKTIIDFKLDEMAPIPQPSTKRLSPLQDIINSFKHKEKENETLQQGQGSASSGRTPFKFEV